MKTAGKLISIVMTAVMAFGVMGCFAQKTDIKELKKNGGIMLTIESIPQESMTKEQFESARSKQTVTYGGAAINPGSSEEDGIMLSDEDYMRIYNFCVEAVAKNKFADYKENVDDGTTYRFTFYDENGEAHLIYDGYMYHNRELMTIRGIVSSYVNEGNDCKEA